MAMAKESLTSEMLSQAAAMASHALRAGIAVPGWALEAIAAAEAGGTAPDRDLIRAHGELARRVAPMKPDLIVALDHEASSSRFQTAIGPLHIARTFLVMVVTSSILFLVLSLSPYLKDPKYASIFTSSGWPLLVNELFFLAAAAVGASFSNLFEINREIAAGTFSSANRSAYWVRFILGVVAGLLLSTVLRIGAIAPSNGSTHMHFQGAALALMGGFSSSVVQRIVQRLIEALESLLQTSADLEVKAREAQHRQELDELLSKERMRTALMLADVRRRIAAGEDPKELTAVVGQASKDMLAGEAELGSSPA
jgi:hypothetical protein